MRNQSPHSSVYAPGAKKPKLTVQSLAMDLNCLWIIRRAITYHPSIQDDLLSIECSFDNKLDKSAGNFNGRTMMINLHPGLKLQQDRQKLIETLLHEVAHAMQYLAYRKCDHGITWFEMMFILGQKPNRCFDPRELVLNQSLPLSAF